ncbi:DUF3461 family protein [uncultured Cocleimonas sp.]|uniref:DUF3461 family protein n=1 Tax=uncultured Cocleimonas sp. TaxID=1051587 RepID=UPI00261D7DB3|nr:DUF3461 family protein [uncultured Cocleimonas sp.]
MSDKYPTLTMMGVTSLQEIERYSLQTTNDIDILRIKYKRTKGSLLPASKKYHFGRSENTFVSDSGSSTIENIKEVSPSLLAATAELNSIVDKKISTKERIVVIMEEFKQLKEETVTRVQYYGL